MTEVTADGIDPSQLHPDRLIGLVAAHQDGVVLREQLAALGLGRGAIAHRRQRGLLRALHDGVALWGTPTPTFRGRARAAVLCAGTGSTATHHAATALWAVRPEPGGRST